MRRTPIPPALLGTAIRTAELTEFGIPRSRLAGGDIQRPHRGVAAFGAARGAGESPQPRGLRSFTDAEEPGDDVVARCEHYLPILLAGQFFSHRTAAQLWGMALPTRREPEVRTLDVGVMAPRTPPRRPGIAGWKLTDVRLAFVDQFPVLGVADTWCHIGSGLRVADAVAAIELLLPAHNRLGATSRADLARAVERHAGKRGLEPIRAALPLLREGVRSRPESLLRLLLTRARLPEPIVEFPVDVGRGIVLHPDLAYPDQRIALEYEGDGHRTSRTQWQRDIERAELLRAAGWLVLRVTATMLFGAPRALVERIRAALRAPRGAF